MVGWCFLINECICASEICTGHQSTGSSAGSGADPSSSELSADTVIYMGPSDDATDGEHPPVYLPSLSSGDNRGVMSKALKGSGVEKQQPSPSKVPGAAKKLVNLKGKFQTFPFIYNLEITVETFTLQSPPKSRCAGTLWKF